MGGLCAKPRVRRVVERGVGDGCGDACPGAVDLVAGAGGLTANVGEPAGRTDRVPVCAGGDLPDDLSVTQYGFVVEEKRLQVVEPDEHLAAVGGARGAARDRVTSDESAGLKLSPVRASSDSI